MSTTRLAYLSQAAHRRAIAGNTLTPAERPEWSHLPMKRIDGIPVFDADRMRPDQVVETVLRLEQITGRNVQGTVRDSVNAYVQDAGRFGVRVKDVCSEVGATKPIVLKYLREMIAAGEVIVTEESTRGAGSKRKRYHWAAYEKQYQELAVEGADGEDTLYARPDSFKGQNEWSGIIYHGSAVDGLLCGCGACQSALESAILAGERSAARRNGETGIAVGLELRRVRRAREQAADKELARAAGLAAV